MLSRDPASGPEICITIRVSDTDIRLYIKNRVDPSSIDALADRLSRLLAGNHLSDYIGQLQCDGNSVCHDPDGLRYLAMMVDHQVDIAWRIEQTGNSANDAWLTTMTSVPMQ